MSDADLRRWVSDQLHTVIGFSDKVRGVHLIVLQKPNIPLQHQLLCSFFEKKNAKQAMYMSSIFENITRLYHATLLAVGHTVLTPVHTCPFLQNKVLFSTAKCVHEETERERGERRTKQYNPSPILHSPRLHCVNARNCKLQLIKAI